MLRWSEVQRDDPDLSFRELLGIGVNMLSSPALCLTNLVSHVSFCSLQGLSRHGNAVFAHFAKRPLFSFQLLNVTRLLANMIQGNVSAFM